jgi:hypothetical protein
LAGVLKHWQHLFIPLPFVIRKCLPHLSPASKPVIESLRQNLCVAEAVRNPLGRERVFVISGITDECPTRAVWFTEKVWQEARSGEPLFTSTAVEAFGESGNTFPDRLHELSFNV